MKDVKSIPDPERTFTAVRNLGYDLNASIADLIDNSIASKVKAKNINISFKRKGDNYIFRMCDDGAGMTGSHLEEAMRLGARTENLYSPDDLGKFGMGLKTASLAHCNVLTVLSKTKGSKLVGYCWNMPHVQKKRKWHLLKMDASECRKLLRKEGIKEPAQGTVVFWDDLFSLFEFIHNSCSAAACCSIYYIRCLVAQ